MTTLYVIKRKIELKNAMKKIPLFLITLSVTSLVTFLPLMKAEISNTAETVVQSENQKWEYRVLKVKWRDWKRAEDILNNHAKEGWRLKHVGYADNSHFIFERKVQ